MTGGHLHDLSASGWSVWRWLCVRGAGFPAAGVLSLASRETADAIDRLLDVEAELTAAFARAILVVKADLESRDPRERNAIRAQLRRLWAKVVPDSVTGLGAASAAAVEAVRSASRAHRECRDATAAVFSAERVRVVRGLHEHAREPRFREALVWQNRNALHSGVDALLRQPETASTSKARRNERLVASHLQRYCVKNDTIGFFGPVGWATIRRDAPAISVVPGNDLVAARTVYFEHWSIDTLAQALAEDPALRRHLAPRRHPTVWVEGSDLHHSVDQTTELPLEFARLLDACDGQRSAHDIAVELLADPELDLSGENEVYELLEDLATKGLAIWTLEVPPHAEHPDRALGALLEGVADREVAASGLARLAELQAARDDVARAAGDPIALELALARLEDTFTRHTGATATRRAGETYAGRTLVFEECRRDLDMTIGPALIDRIRSPLALLLASARWFTYTLARRYCETFVALHRELEAATGSPSVDFLRFWQHANVHFSGNSRSAPPLVAGVAEELQRRWASLLGLEGEALERHRIDVTADQLANGVAAMFDAPCPGWPSARHHSPDLMVAANSVDAIARGELVVVVSELHVAAATVATPVDLRQHPDPEKLVAALGHDRPFPIIEAVVSKERTSHVDGYSVLPTDLDLEVGVGRSWRDRAQVVEAGSLRVEPAGGSLRVRTRDGAHHFALEEFFNSFLSNESSSHFRLLPKVPHCPRISIDGFVICRESWQFDASALGFAHVEDPVERMLATRRWARAHQLPRFLFYKVPEETKPCFVDLESPHYVDVLAHLAKQASALVVSEMLPTVDQAWLPDAAGARYTCELRIVAVDPEPWRETFGSAAVEPDA